MRLICLCTERCEGILSQKFFQICKRLILIQICIKCFRHDHHVYASSLNLCDISHLCRIVKLVSVCIGRKVYTNIHFAVRVVSVAKILPDLFFQCIRVISKRIYNRYGKHRLDLCLFTIIFGCKYKGNRCDHSEDYRLIIHPDVFQPLSHAHSF